MLGDAKLTKVQGINTNILLFIMLTIIIVFLGILTSIVLFTYQNSITAVNENRRNIEATQKDAAENLQLTREIPQQNLLLLREANNMLSQMLQNQMLLMYRLNQTDDNPNNDRPFSLNPSSVEILPQTQIIRQVTATSGGTNLSDAEALFNNLTEIMKQMKEQIIQQGRQNSSTSSEINTLPFLNREYRVDTLENESMLKEPEGGRIAGFPPSPPE